MNTTKLAYYRAAIGLIQGLVLYQLMTALNNHFTTPLGITAVIFIFVPVIIAQSLGNIRTKTLCIWSSALAILLGLLFYKDAVQFKSDDYLVSGFFLFCTVGVFISHILVWSGDIDKKFMANYPTYFDVAWKFALQIIFSLVFLLIATLLLIISSYLLDFAGIPLSQIIIEPWFVTPYITLMIAIGLHITDAQPKLLRGMRSLCLVLFSSLLPVVDVVVLLFLIGIISQIVRHGVPSLSMAELYGIVWFLLFGINATYQDGNQQETKNKLFQYAATVGAILFAPIVVLIIMQLQSSITHEFIDSGTVDELAFVFILLVYSLGYLFAAFASSVWLKMIETWNFIAALIIILVIFALSTPLANPKNVAALFHAHPSQPATLHYSSVPSSTADISQQEKRARIIVHQSSIPFPESFFLQDWRKVQNRQRVYCMVPEYENSVCDAWVMKMTPQSHVSILLYTNGVFNLLEQGDNNWNVVGYWLLPQFDCKGSGEDIKKGLFSFVAAEMPDIEVRGMRNGYNRVSLGRCGK